MRITHSNIGLLLSLLIFLSILPAGCAPAVTATPTAVVEPTATSVPEVLAEPRLRITNAGQTEIRNLTVLLPNSRIFFGDVPAGATTAYQPAPKGVYNYAAYEFDTDEGTVTEPFLDWIGESPLPGQSYTYIIELDLNRPQMQRMRLIEVKAELNN